MKTIRCLKWCNEKTKMLSILIPTFNYDVTALVTEVHKQSIACKIEFEILVYDDASTDLKVIKNNTSINALEDTSYTILKSNIGRSAIRNKLAKTAQYEWLLFLDADVMTVNDNFVSNYINSLSDSKPIINGGISYQKEKPEQSQLLRWIYGKKREALNSEIRKKNQHISLLSSNFLIKQETLKKIKSDEKMARLCNEDTLYSYNLKQKEITISDIENTVDHLGLETREAFLKKSLQNIDTLNLFLKQKLSDARYMKNSRDKYKVRKLKLDIIFAVIFHIFKKQFEKNLLTNRTSLFIFELYRLSNICYIQRK